MSQRIIAILAALIAAVGAFRANMVPKRAVGWSRASEVVSSAKPVIRTRAWMAMAEEKTKVDFSTYAVGQEYTGTLVGAKQFGVFVDIKTGTNVLLPRSLLSRGNYEKLKQLSDSKSKETVKIEIVGVSAENQTLSGKYIPAGYKVRPDLSTLSDKDVQSRFFNATVVSAHDFGVFAELDEFGVEGLIPVSKLPGNGGSVQKSFKAGQQISVQIDELNVEGKKLVLSMKSESRADVSAFENVPHDRWFQGVITSVSNFGLFVRPAGYDCTGLVHASRVPRDLIAALKKVAPVAPNSNKTDIEALFSEGDVLKVRAHQVSVGTRRLELSMLPYRANDDEDDDYIVEGRDPEGEEEKFAAQDSADEDVVEYDAEDTLLWWRGEPYKKVGVTHEEEAPLEEEFEVLNESNDVIEGVWRRMFEVDMREDEADFSSKALEAEIKELEEEIGELNGLDEEVFDTTAFGMNFAPSKLGSFVSVAGLPADWKNDLEFFKEAEAAETAKRAALRAGKASEQAEFEALLREVEVELEQAAARAPKREEPVAAAAEEEPAAPAAPEAEA